MRVKQFSFFLLLFIFVFLSGLSAQSSSTNTSAAASTFEFPLWARDLRRAEIIAFGSFPFMYFFSNFGFDAYRCISHGWDTRYAPWPFNSSGTIEQTQTEKFMTLGIAAGGAIVIAIVDYGIMRYKRSRLERESRNLPEGTPIIIRRPLYGEEAEVSESALPETESP